MNEIWKDIEEYEGIYQVSNLGRVKSLKFGKEKIIKGRNNSMGYLYVALCKEGKIKYFRVHRLVASAFIPNSNNLFEVNHKDENPLNNRIDNLEWCDRKYNINYGTRIERIQKPILQFSKTGEFIKKWDSAIKVERVVGFYHSEISRCCKGKKKSAYGYKWCYHYKSIWERKHIPQIKLRKVA